MLTPPRLVGVDETSFQKRHEYVTSVVDVEPGADEKIVFDKFHIAKHMGDAVDLVRRQEHRALMAQGG